MIAPAPLVAMAFFAPFSVRDVVALAHLIVRWRHPEGRPPTDRPADVVRNAFEYADAFIEQSDSRWAQSTRPNHQRK